MPFHRSRLLIRSTRGQRFPGNPTRGPSGLKIKNAGEAVDVEQFAGKVEAGAKAAFHGLEVHLAQTHAAARDKLVLVQALARDLKFCADQLLDQPVSGGPRERSASGRREDTAAYWRCAAGGEVWNAGRRKRAQQRWG